MKAAYLSLIFLLLVCDANATSLGSALTKDAFEKRCNAELDARKKQDGSVNFCSAYLIGFLDGASNPVDCEIMDINFFINQFISYSSKQNSKYFGKVVKSFVANGCKAL